jgi:anti-sigma factor RsiW
MSRLFSSCARHRESLSLLAAGALPPEERAEVASHLAACADCQKYFGEIKAVTTPLATWEQNFANVEPSPASLARWEKDFAAAVKTRSSAWKTFVLWFLDWSRDVVWPCRRIWTGLAAVWVVILAVNFSQREPAEMMVAKSARPSPELVRAFLEQEGFLAVSVAPAKSPAKEPPEPPVTQPRSEQRQNDLRT